MQKVAGERYVYKFVCDPKALFNMAYGSGGSSSLPAEVQSGARTQAIAGKVSATNDVHDLAKHPTSGYGDAVLAMYSNTAAGQFSNYIRILFHCVHRVRLADMCNNCL